MKNKLTPAVVREIIKDEYLKRGMSNEFTQIMSDLNAHRAFLFLNREKDGFLVLKCNDELCWVSFAYCARAGAIRRHFGFLIEVATYFSCKRIGCQTFRPGFERILPTLGFKQVGDGDNNFAIEWEF